jgi:KaiC/GvpD/RAD55 family RecA-like ATPase
MERVPFGIERFDTTIGGGAPRGSVVLLSGEAGAGAREFMFTTAVMNGLAQTDHDLFDLHYGDITANASLPGAIHYISFTAGEDQLRNEIGMAMGEEIATAGLDTTQFSSLSKNYFHTSPVPRSWYAGDIEDITSLRKRHEDRQSILSALGDLLNEYAHENLVIIDSLSDLVSTVDDEGLSWSDVSYLVKGLAKASHHWSGLILLHVNRETLTATQHGQLIDACSGTLRFEWESGGSTRARTLVVKSFQGVLSQIEAENIVKFETDLGDAGFDISDVRKIR